MSLNFNITTINVIIISMFVGYYFANKKIELAFFFVRIELRKKFCCKARIEKAKELYARLVLNTICISLMILVYLCSFIP